MIKLSVVICTYNRSHLLRLCLESLTQQTIDSSHFEITIVDNNSTDDTATVAFAYKTKFLNFHYIIEPQIGLSFARNTGYKAANTDWIVYIDDDAKAHSNYIERITEAIQQNDFQCIGGLVINYYDSEPPRWASKDAGGNQNLALKYPQISLMIDNDSAWGGNICFNKTALMAVGGFNTSMGMRGKTIGYGEETDVQFRMRNKGFRIAFDPEWKVDHLTFSHKLSIRWQISSAYGAGKDYVFIEPRKFIFFIIQSFRLIKTIVKSTGRWFIDKNFYWENLLIRIGCLLAFNIGFWQSSFSSKKKLPSR